LTLARFSERLPISMKDQQKIVQGLACGLCAAVLSSACAPEKSKTPGISLGAPEVRWGDKNEEQRYGFMAAQVHPTMEQIFIGFNESYSEGFTCETCHGSEPELVDYKTPSPQMYELPREDPIGTTMADDEEMGNFMMGEVTPGLQKLFDMGKGTATKVTCFSCHPAEE
jgi:hypothetical protein